MRVCMVVAFDLSEPGGIKHHAVELARSLRDRGDEVTLIGPASRPTHEHGTVGFRGVRKIVSNGSDNSIGIFVRPWQVWSFFRRHRFDLIHVHEPLQPSLPYWTVWSTPSTPHLATFHAFGEGQSWRLRAAARAFASIQFPFIHRGIAVSDAAASYASQTWRRPLGVIPNGVRTEVFRPVAPSANRTLRLLFVGRVSDDRKGIRYLLDAYRSVRDAGCDVELSVVGDSSSSCPLPTMPGVTYHGALPLRELVAQYQACDVFVAPSTGQESFGIVLLEAMACGKAVISSDITGYRWAASGGGVLKVAPQSVSDLVAAIECLAADRARVRVMGERNRLHAESYDWDLLANEVREQYLETIAAVRPKLLTGRTAPRLLGRYERKGSQSPGDDAGAIYSSDGI
jgi:phosphatidyl-myo-inositol alpha-mannosyltransferase